MLRLAGAGEYCVATRTACYYYATFSYLTLPASELHQPAFVLDVNLGLCKLFAYLLTYLQ